jgi:hypothetical protein
MLLSAEMEQIDLKWVEFWMVEALMKASLPDVIVDLPSSKVSCSICG